MLKKTIIISLNFDLFVKLSSSKDTQDYAVYLKKKKKGEKTPSLFKYFKYTFYIPILSQLNSMKCFF